MKLISHSNLKLVTWKLFSDITTWCQEVAPPDAQFQQDQSTIQSVKLVDQSKVELWTRNHFQMAPPGAQFWKESSSHYDHIPSLRLIGQSNVELLTRNSLQTGTFHSSTPIHISSLKLIGQSNVELWTRNHNSTICQ